MRNSEKQSPKATLLGQPISRISLIEDSETESEEDEEEIKGKEEEESEESEEEIVDLNWDESEKNDIVTLTIENNKDSIDKKTPYNNHKQQGLEKFDSDEEIKYEELFKNQLKANFETLFLNSARTLSNNKNQSSIKIKSIQKNQSAKTVFSKISEEIFQKEILQGKGINNLKSKYNPSNLYLHKSAYDSLTNNVFLNHELSKNNQKSKSKGKIKSFLERNVEVNLKELSRSGFSFNNILSLKKSQIASEVIPRQSIAFSKNHSIRSTEEYLNDQLKFQETKEAKLKTLREEKKRTIDREMKSKPQICNKSRSLIMNSERNSGYLEKQCHDRLYEEHSQKKKSDIYLKSSSRKKNSSNPLLDSILNSPVKEIKKKLTKEEVNTLVSKLTLETRSPAGQTLQNTLNNNDIPGENNYMLTSNSSIMTILRKFIKEYEMNLNLLLHQNLDCNPQLSFDDFTDMLLCLGFVNNDHRKAKLSLLQGANATMFINSNSLDQFNINVEGVNIAKNNDLPQTLRNQDQVLNPQNNTQESIRPTDNFLIQNTYNNEIINTTQFKFNNLATGVNPLLDDLTLKKLDQELLLIKDSWRVLTKKKNIEGTERVESNLILLFLLSILGLYPGENIQEKERDGSNLIIIEDGEEKCSNANTINNINNQTLSPQRQLISSPNKSLVFRDKVEQQQLNVNLLIQIMPNFNSKIYNWNFKVVKEMKIFFRRFYDNRYHNLVYMKEEKERLKLKHRYADNHLTFSPKISKKTDQAAIEKRDKMTKETIREEEERNFIIQNGVQKKSRKLSITDVYDIIKKKKQKYF
jgi:hypothetical protein